MPNLDEDNKNSNDKSDPSNATDSSTPSSADTANTPTEPAAPANAFNTPDFDTSEITRKLDGIIETQSLLSKAISQLISNRPSTPAPSAASSTRPDNASPQGSPKTIDQLNL